jgi:hypothetical protein
MKRKKMTEEEMKVAIEKQKREEKMFPWFHDIPGKERGEIWFWCMHCEQCFQGKEALPYLDDGSKLFGCPNFWDKGRGRCTGSPIDWQHWERFRKDVIEAFGVEYPLIPEKGKDYPMYPDLNLRKKEEILRIRN